LDREPKTGGQPRPFGRRTYERKGENPKEAAERRRPEGSNLTDQTYHILQTSSYRALLNRLAGSGLASDRA
jgi:hypothetical protein